MFWGFAITVLDMWFTMKSGLRPWINWQNVHFNFSRVGLFPALLIPPKSLLTTYIIWWTIPISTGLFFAFFAFGQDALKEYHACYLWVRRTVFRLSNPSQELSLPS
jgi:pheromone a factor receptor